MDDKKQPVAKIGGSGKFNLRQFFKVYFAKASLKYSKRKIIKIATIALLILVVGGFVWQYQQRNARLAAMSSVVEGLAPAQQAQYYSDQGEYKIAEKIWQDQMAKTTDTPTKLNIYYMQSAIAVKFKNYKDAKKYADEALTLAPKSSAPYVALAQLAQAQGDKVTARQNWQQAIKFIDPKNPASNLIQRDYQSSLDALK